MLGYGPAWLDRNVLALNQSEPLKRRFEVIFGRIKKKILGDLQDVAIEDRFLLLVLPRVDLDVTSITNSGAFPSRQIK